MKKNEVLDCMEYVDAELIRESEMFVPARKNRLIGRVALAACLCLAVLGMSIGSGLLSQNGQTDLRDHRWPVKHIAPKTETNLPIITKDTWAATGNAGKYTRLSFSDETFITCLAAIPEEARGELLGGGTATGQDLFSLEMHEQSVTVFGINGVDPSCMVAIAFSESDGSVTGADRVYAYMNVNYRPKTLGDWFHDLDIGGQCDIGLTYWDDAYGDKIVFENVEKEKVVSLLLAATGAKNEPDAEKGKVVMSISFSFLNLEKTIFLSENGMLWTNFLETSNGFSIGAEKVSAFVQFVTENCDGYLYVYDALDGLTGALPE